MFDQGQQLKFVMAMGRVVRNDLETETFEEDPK